MVTKQCILHFSWVVILFFVFVFLEPTPAKPKEGPKAPEKPKPDGLFPCHSANIWEKELYRNSKWLWLVEDLSDNETETDVN